MRNYYYFTFKIFFDFFKNIFKSLYQLSTSYLILLLNNISSPENAGALISKKQYNFFD